MTIKKVGKLVRDGWLIGGITIALLCVIEGSLALTFFVKDRLAASGQLVVDRRAMADTYTDRSWVNDCFAEFRRSYAAQWRPYVYWRRVPFRGHYINVDSNGFRLTASPKPMPQGSCPPLKIFMFGGSALWGTGARDAFTVPSILARELQRSGVASEVTNFGESGYVSTQEVIALLLQLQEGRAPDVVIFYDGLNDTYSAYQQRVAGLPENEHNRNREFNLSHPAKLRERGEMVLQDLARRLSTLRAMKGLLRKTGLWHEPALAARSLPAGNPAPGAEALAHDVLATYRGNIELVRALGEHYHFRSLFYWQPTIFQKPHLTDFERARRAEQQTVEQFVERTCAAVRQGGLPESGECSFHDLSLVFADVREPVFIDWCHLGESGNEIVAKKMAQNVLGLMIADK
jgi:lysophospholipase L1-like esterase